MDASQYKDYVLVLLFMKYVTDRFRGDPDAPIVVPPGGSFDEMLAVRGDKEIGDHINKIVGALAEANSALEGVITVADFNDAQKLGEGREMVERLTNLVNIFARPELDFSDNDADGDDLLGDAYEYLMRHFATESGKSKGQFYTPAEVSRVIAQLVGADGAKSASETVYDPTCGSGSLLLKVQAAAPVRVTLYGQEKDNATRALAVMNSVLHGDATADIRLGNTLANPRFRAAGERVQQFDYVVANPPFSDKAWRNGLSPEDDTRFELGIPPNKQGDYAYLLHVLSSMKARGRGVIVLPHGVLFRGNREGDIREKLVRRGWIAGVVGLPANLFYGTGIPACLVVLDKARSPGSPIMMIDASRGFVKDGPKNRLRHQDVHRIVDVWRKQVEVANYARLIPFAEIEKNGFNLNLPRYVDSGRRADQPDLAAHILGGIPEADVELMRDWWAEMPNLRAALFRPGERAKSLTAAVSIDAVRQTVTNAPEFLAFINWVQAALDGWRGAHVQRLENIDSDTAPKALIATLAEDLLERFRPLPLIDAYDVYQRLMAQWDDGMGDDVGVLARDSWMAAGVINVISRDKDGKYPDVPDLVLKRGRSSVAYKAQLVPPELIVKRFFEPKATELAEALAEVERLGAELQVLAEEQAGDEGLLAAALSEKDALTAASVKARRKAILEELGWKRAKAEAAVAASEFGDEWDALTQALSLITRHDEAKAHAKALKGALDEAVVARYVALTETEAKQLVVHDKWLLRLEMVVLVEVLRLGGELANRVGTLVERYRTPLPTLVEARDAATVRVKQHLSAMGVAWN
ncbi:type I restriction enzyme M protein [Methylorubrum extorquens]